MSHLQFTSGAGHRRGRARQTRPMRSQPPLSGIKRATKSTLFQIWQRLAGYLLVFGTQSRAFTYRRV